jgi:hypothetical protein
MGNLIVLEDYMKRKCKDNEPGRHQCKACESLGINNLRAFSGGQEYRFMNGRLCPYEPGFLDRILKYPKRLVGYEK